MGSSRSEFGGGKGFSQGVGLGEMQELYQMTMVVKTPRFLYLRCRSEDFHQFWFVGERSCVDLLR